MNYRLVNNEFDEMTNYLQVKGFEFIVGLIGVLDCGSSKEERQEVES